jgi:hypothetical protein
MAYSDEKLTCVLYLSSNINVVPEYDAQAQFYDLLQKNSNLF